jgi:hypothetical protein
MSTRQTGPEYAEFVRLATYTVTTPGKSANAQTANTLLDSNQSAEITHFVIRSPIAPLTGIGDGMEHVQPYVNSKYYDGGNRLLIRADLDTNLMPPTEQITQNKIDGSLGTIKKVVQFGLGMPDMIAMGSKDILQNTTVKVGPGQTFAVNYMMGDLANALGNLTVDVYGWRYNTKTILEKYIRNIYGQAYNLRFKDPHFNRDFLLNYPAQSTNANDFTKLIGGQDQGSKSGQMIVHKLMRWARNSTATTPNQEYQLDIDISHVAQDYQSLKFKPQDNQLYIFNKLGVRDYTGNLSQVIAKVNGQKVFEPYINGIENPYRFGRVTAVSPGMSADQHSFIPPTVTPAIMMHNETGVFELVDNGTSIPASDVLSGVLVTVEGLLIEADQLKNQ